MKIFLDDVRDCPHGWVLIRHPEDVVALLKSDEVEVTELSLDYDLGYGIPPGTYVTDWIEEAVMTNGFIPPKIRIHSSSPIGIKVMRQTLDNILNKIGG